MTNVKERVNLVRYEVREYHYEHVNEQDRDYVWKSVCEAIHNHVSSRHVNTQVIDYTGVYLNNNIKRKEDENI